jgi:hypothetical protein
MIKKYGLIILIGALFPQNESFSQSTLQNYVFFNVDRERIREADFLHNDQIKGAQLKYTWPELEPKKGKYHFEAIQQDMDFLSKNGKGLFIQIQDVSFDTSIVNIPRYLFDDPLYNGGANFQYGRENDEAPYHVEGWVARRWDEEVAHRFHALLMALGEKFDGKIEGINLPETSIGVGSEDMHPQGFTYEAYLGAIKENMRVLKAAFPSSCVIMYANFMPGDDFPLTEDSYLKRLYRYAREIKVGMGGPDIKVHKWWPMRHSYPLIRESDGLIPTGVAVQWGNYAVTNPKTKKQVTVPEIYEFGEDYLKLDYLFWGTQEPYYSEVVLPFLQALKD